MALTRARVIAGPESLARRMRDAIEIAVASSGEATSVRRDAASMRARMDRDLPHDGPWDAKLRPGGQIDVEFITQVEQLLHAWRHPEIRSPTTRVALGRLADSALIDRSEAEMLIRADRLWRTVQGILRITIGRSVHEPLPDAAGRALLRATAADVGAIDLAALSATMDDVALAVRRALVRVVGDIGE
jgi:glutamate-ammonia-ligase adenylyltransferase